MGKLINLTSEFVVDADTVVAIIIQDKWVNPETNQEEDLPVEKQGVLITFHHDLHFKPLFIRTDWDHMRREKLEEIQKLVNLGRSSC